MVLLAFKGTPLIICTYIQMYFYVNVAALKMARHRWVPSPVNRNGHEGEHRRRHRYSLDHSAYLTHRAAKRPTCWAKQKAIRSENSFKWTVCSSLGQVVKIETLVWVIGLKAVLRIQVKLDGRKATELTADRF